MKKFTCHCIDEQFKRPEQVFVDFEEKAGTEILCAYRPNEKVTLRRIKLDINCCPVCGQKLEEI